MARRKKKQGDQLELLTEQGRLDRIDELRKEIYQLMAGLDEAGELLEVIKNEVVQDED